MAWSRFKGMRSGRRASRAAVFACIIGLFPGTFPVPAGAASAVNCQDAAVPVVSQGASYSISGTLCSPGGQAPSAVMILVPGTTYTRSYWDVPVNPEVHNFRQAMNQSGYATFSLDRLGSGRSSTPLSAQVTGTAQADTLHGVVQALRSGRVGERAFDKVIIGGHSLGSADVIYEAARYRDVDGVLLTGFSHHLNLANIAVLFTPGVGITPAFLDPKFSGKSYDPGYVTTLPTGRRLLYGPGDVSPEVQRWDEANKDVSSLMEVATAFPGATPLPAMPVVSPTTRLPSSQSISADVLLVNGRFDNIVCIPELRNCRDSGALLDSERPFYPNARTLQAEVIAGSGHDLNLSKHSPEYQDIVADWVETTVLNR